jgi:hypothetical protein
VAHRKNEPCFLLQIVRKKLTTLTLSGQSYAGCSENPIGCFHLVTSLGLMPIEQYPANGCVKSAPPDFLFLCYLEATIDPIDVVRNWLLANGVSDPHRI